MIGVFDSGFGGLTVLKSIVSVMPQYAYLYLGDNARVPYGTRSQAMVYEFTKQAVDYLFRRGCPLVIIACNTASARALRKIQQEFLPEAYPDRRVLGVIRPSAEEIAARGIRAVGVLATEGVVASGIYGEEIQALAPDIHVYQQACPLLVPIIEAGEAEWEGTDLIISKYLRQLFSQCGGMETILLACTHYPILHEQFVRQAGSSVAVLDQGPIVAEKLKEYLARHPDIENRISKDDRRCFLTTDISDRFDRLALVFYGEPVASQLVSLDSLCM
jgi:glutamate racemase